MRITAKNGMIIETAEANVIGFETSFYDNTINMVILKAGKIKVTADELNKLKLKLRNHVRSNRNKTTNSNSQENRVKTIQANSL